MSLLFVVVIRQTNSHDGRYMVYNLGEMEYPTQVLENQVTVYKFPGSPAPPPGFIYWNIVMVEGIWCTI